MSFYTIRPLKSQRAVQLIVEVPADLMVYTKSLVCTEILSLRQRLYAYNILVISEDLG